MDAPTNEKQLLADIDRLREQFRQTQDLYREVSVLLFFRYGITPTANKLFKLVRKGSMMAPAEALNRFWEDLRENSRGRTEHPDLPDTLKSAAGELTATRWRRLKSERDTAHQRLEKTQQALVQANERINTLDQQLAAAAATKMSLESQLQQAQNENTTHQQRLADARRDFTVELDKLRACGATAR
jgi:hypothetical protein